MKVLVTGASGYVGNQLCHALRKQGYSVRALLRHTSDFSSLPSSPDDDFEIIYGDITDYGSLLSAFDGCTTVFHAAGLTEMWLPDPSQFFKIHSEKKFSSEYERSQVAALKVAMEAGAEGVPIVVVYLCIVYGPGKLTAGNLIAHLLVEQFKGGILGRTEFGKNVISFGHIDDVVKGHIDDVKRGKVGEAYLLTGQNVSFEHVFDLVAKLTSKPKPKIRFPLWVIEILGSFLVLRYRFTGRLPYVTPPVVNTYRQEWAFSCEKAKLHLDYNPRNLEDGVLDVVVWLKGIKLIDY
ncbi:Putative dihydroflavonol 4-reductase [Linum perenne]